MNHEIKREIGFLPKNEENSVTSEKFKVYRISSEPLS